MAEPIAALIVRILADTSEMVTGVKNVSGQLDALENRVSKFGKAIAGYFTVQALKGFANEILADVQQIDNAAKQLGTTSEEFQKFSYAVKQSGGDVGNATTQIASLTDKLGSGDTGLFNVLRKLNINLDEFKAKDAVPRFVDLAQAINGVSDPTKQLELRLEAMGVKGVAALTAVNADYKNLADNAPTYSDEAIKSIKRVEDAYDDLWTRVKANSAEAGIALFDFLDLRKTQILDENGAPKFFSGDGGVPAPPRRPSNQPASLGMGGVDPNNVNQLALAYAELKEKLVAVTDTAASAKEEFDAMNFILKTLKMEVPQLAAAMQPLMAAFDTSTKVDHMAARILNLASKITELRVESNRLMEVINPGSTKMAGDDVDAELFKLRDDPSNFGKDGNLSEQALAIEHLLINNFSLGLMAKSLTPASGGSTIDYSNLQAGRFASVMNPPSITINAQGSYLSDPDSLNRLARLVGDQLAKREGFNSAFSRR